MQATLKQSGHRYRNRSAELLRPSCCVQGWLQVSLYRSIVVFPKERTSFHDAIKTSYMLSVAFLTKNIFGNEYIVN